jgi:hypothetical protein
MNTNSISSAQCPDVACDLPDALARVVKKLSRTLTSIHFLSCNEARFRISAAQLRTNRERLDKIKSAECSAPKRAARYRLIISLEMIQPEVIKFACFKG